MKNITLVRSDADWEALYVEGVSKIQGHSVSLRDALKLVAELGEPITFDAIHIDCPEDWGMYPETLTEIMELA